MPEKKTDIKYAKCSLDDLNQLLRDLNSFNDIPNLQSMISALSKKVQYLREKLNNTTQAEYELIQDKFNNEYDQIQDKIHKLYDQLFYDNNQLEDQSMQQNQHTQLIIEQPMESIGISLDNQEITAYYYFLI